jgi:arylsulfatase A-like enzyme/tetratricopeptide (TPR) repeat protein
MPRRAVAVAGLALAALVSSPCSSVRDRLGGGASGPLNLLLISIDTLRADHLGSYGYAPARTPYLDALAARGWRFAQATTVVPLTLPAHASLMTGTFPGFNGVRDNGGFYLPDDQVTLAETLRGQGYRTGGFVGSFVLDSRWGIGQGFDRYFDDFDLSKYEGVGMDVVQRRGDEVVKEALKWLGQAKEKPFFAWVHLYDPHTPYDAPEPFRAGYPATPVGAYDAEIAWTDSLVGRLVESLAGDGRLERTLVVAVGDHGESLGEHGEQTHGFFIYDATVRIPLIVAGPGVAAREVGDQVRIVDVMPTALEMLGVSAPPHVQGRSLAPLGRGEHLGLLALSETWYPRYHYGWSELRAARDGRYKFILAPRRELYDVRADPGETVDLSGRDPSRTDTFQEALSRETLRVSRGSAARGPQRIDPDAEERLQALGYVGASLSPRSLEDRPRGDPKDKIGLYGLLHAAAQASVEGRLDEAIAMAREALAKDPGIVEGHTLLGNFHAKAKRYDEAARAYRDALRLDPEHQGAVFSLALAYKNMGRLDEAQAGFERSHALDPRNTKALWQLADIWMQQGRFEKAEAALKDGLSQKADRPSFLLKLGECEIEMKRYAEAERALGEALSAKPDLAGAHYNLALAREAAGDVRGAQAEYEAELQRNPKAYRASFNLGKILLRSGRPRDAAARFREAVESNPGFGTGQLYLAKSLLDAGELQAAREWALKGLASKPDRAAAPLGHYVLADVYTRLGLPQDAAREAAAARKREREGS